MTRPAPPVDPRGPAELVADTTRLAQLLSPWRPPDAGTDLGSALIAVFADMADEVLRRQGLDAEELEEGEEVTFGNGIEPPQHLVGHVGEDGDQCAAEIGSRVGRPPR